MPTPTPNTAQASIEALREALADHDAVKKNFALEPRTDCFPASAIRELLAYVTTLEADAATLRERNDFLLGATRDAQQMGSSYADKLAATVSWLEANQPDVFKRGLWDAIRKAQGDAAIDAARSVK